MDSFSLSDRLYAAVATCLSCFGTRSENESDESNTNGNDHRIRRVRSDELEGLLADVVDTDTEAETMSLHSNPSEGRQRPPRRGVKRITVFGWNLFGRPAIRLPEDGEDEDDVLRRRIRRGGGGGGGGTHGTISSATLDSDAAPLESSAIEELSSEQAQERARVAEAEERRVKEERRALRKERKVIKRSARALALGVGDDGFEGFQGSGDAYPHVSAFNRSHSAASASDSRSSGDVYHVRTGTEDVDDADLGGELYARKAPLRNSDGSDSRSRTSASRSQDNPARYNHHYISQQPQPHTVPLPSRSELSSLTSSSGPPRRKKRSSKPTYDKSSSSTSNSQPSSLPSPVTTTFATSPSPGVALPSSPLSMPHQGTPLETIPFEGYPDGYEFPSSVLRGDALPSPGLGHGGLPSSGFGGPRRKNRDMGAFLATRGDS